MGLFSFIGSACRAVGRAVGRGMEWFGEKTGWEGLEKAGRDLQDRCAETAHFTGQTRSYDRDTASVEQTQNIAEILSGFSLGLKGQAETIERQTKQYVEGYFDAMIKLLENSLGPCAAVRNLNSQKRLVVQGIGGQIAGTVSRRASLADSECEGILRMSAGSEKERKMDAFGRKVIQEGLDSLSAALERSLDSVVNSVWEEMDTLAEDRRRELENVARQLNTVMNRRMKDTESTEETMLLPAKRLAALDLALDLVEEREAA